MSGRVATFAWAGLLALLLVCCAVTKRVTAAPKQKTINLDKAQHEVLAWNISDSLPYPHAWMMQTCCDCGLVHRWLLIPTKEEGIHAYIWRLEPETKKERRRRGIYDDMYRDPWRAEGRLD